MPVSRAKIIEAYIVLGLEDVRDEHSEESPSLTIYCTTQEASLEVVKSTYKQASLIRPHLNMVPDKVKLCILHCVPIRTRTQAMKLQQQSSSGLARPITSS